MNFIFYMLTSQALSVVPAGQVARAGRSDAQLLRGWQGWQSGAWVISKGRFSPTKHSKVNAKHFESLQALSVVPAGQVAMEGQLDA